MNTTNSLDIENFIKANYITLGPAAMMEKFKISRGAVVGIAKKFKLKMTKRCKSELYTRLREKPAAAFNVNHLNFEFVKLPDVAYILGFLWADGTLSDCGRSNSIRCSIADDDGLNIEKTFMLTGNWNVYHGRTRKDNIKAKPQATFHTNNKYLFNLLKTMDYKNKTGASPCKILNHIPENLRHYWWRGYFDGDGCIFTKESRINVSLTAPFSQDWQFVSNLMNSINIKKYTIAKYRSKDNHKSSKVSIYSKSECLKFMNYIYMDRIVDGIGLDRKYEKFKAFDFSYKRPNKLSRYYGVRVYGGKFIARLSKSSLIGLDKDVHLGTFSTDIEARDAVLKYLNSKNTEVPEKFGEKLYDSSTITR